MTTRILAAVAAVLLLAGHVAPAGAADAEYRSQMRMVNRYLAQAQFDAAARILEQVLTRHPDDPVATVTYADVLLKLERYDDAASFLDRAIAGQSAKADLYRMREALYRARGQHDLAFGDIVRVLETAGRERALWAYRETEELMKTGLAGDRARRLSEEARERHQDGLEYLVLDHVVTSLAGRQEEALRRSVDRDRDRKREGEDVLRFAEALRSLGREEDALAALNAAAGLAGKPHRRSDILLQAVEIQERHGRYREALAGLERIAAERAGSAAAANALLRSAQIRQEHLSDPRGALAVYEKIQDDPSLGHHRPSMLAQMADSYARLGRFDEAAAKYRQVIPEAFDPEDQEHAAYALAQIELFRGNPDSALVLYQEMAESHPRSRFADQAASHYILLNKLSMAGNVEAAKAWGKLEWALLVGDSTAVTRSAEPLLRERPADPRSPASELAAEALLALAEVEAAGGNAEAAMGHLESVVTGHPGDRRAPEALLRQGDLLHRSLGRPEEALARYETLLTQYPASVQAGEARRMVETLRRELKS